MSRTGIEEVFLAEDDLRLRHPRAEDAALLARWWSDPEVRFGFCSEPRSEEEIRSAFAELENEARDIGHWIDWIIEEAGVPVGTIWFSRWDLDDRSCELNILIGESQRRSRGVARRAIRLVAAWAFPRMELRRIYLCPREDHVPAVRCYQRAGARMGEIREQVVVWEGEAVCFRELVLEREDFVAE